MKPVSDDRFAIMQNEAILRIVSIVYLTLLQGKSWVSNFNVSKFEQFIGDPDSLSPAGLIKADQSQSQQAA